MGSDTQGTEPSKYLEEKKTIEIPLVAASEEGRAQTLPNIKGIIRNSVFDVGLGVVGPCYIGVRNLLYSGMLLGRATKEGESPVREI